MSNKPLTEQQRANISEGMLRFYDSEQGRKRIEELKNTVPWNKATGKPKPPKRIIREVAQYTKEGQYIRRWRSISEASAELNICFQGIWYAASGLRKSAGGYKWKYAPA